jgi:hypothetical protein
MDHIPVDLLELQARFDQWRANRKYNREHIPDRKPPADWFDILFDASNLPTGSS